MGDEDEGLRLLLVQPTQQIHDIGRGLAVQVARGLVAPHDGGLVHQSPGDGHPLLLTAGEFGWSLVFLIGKANQLQDLHSLPSGLVLLDP